MSERESYRKNQSLFGPVILIGVGVFFLLRNLGHVPQANFGILFRLWPLWLIFLGLNIVAQNLSGRLGSLASGLVAITAVFTASYLVFFSEDNALLTRLGVNNTRVELIHEPISFDPEDISAANIELNFGLVGADIYALEPSDGLIDGTVSYTEALIFDTSVDGGTATVDLETKSSDFWNWIDTDESDRWQIGLNPRTPIDLEIYAGAGAVNFDLAGLTLTNLDIDLGAGSTIVALPNGDYDFKLEAGAGSTRIAFPENGRIQADLNGGAGSFNLTIPESLPARIEIHHGLGSTNLPSDFTLVDGDQEDGIWESPNYSDGQDGLEIFIDVGLGSVSVEQ